MKFNGLISAAALLAFTLPVTADEVILDDLIIDGSACIGSECASGEVFEFDTLRLKGPQPQLRFDDTSNTASFPNTDWLMGLGEGSPGQAPYFFIRDVSGDTDVLLIEPGENGGIALGAGAERIPGAISVGASGTERRVSNVADGVENTDAATLGQLETYTANLASELQANQTLQTDLTQRMDTLRSSLEALTQRLDDLTAQAVR